MNLEDECTVTYPAVIFKLCLLLIFIFIIVLLTTTVYTQSVNTAAYICVSIFIFMPAAFTALWAKMFRIKLSNRKLNIRKCFGLIHYCCGLDDIIRVECKSIETKFGINESITIFFKDNKKIAVGTMMTNFEKIKAYIENNVSADRIHKYSESRRYK